MVSLLSRGVGLLAKSLVGLSCSQATRCSSLPGAPLTLQFSIRWFSKQQSLEDLPKRPLSSYLRFLVQQRPAVVRQYPEAKRTDVFKLLALEWRGLSESARKPYIEAANEERLKYKDEVRRYKQKLSPHELELLKNKRKLRLVKREHIRHKRELTMLGKPKRSRSAYNIFVSEHFHDSKGTSVLGKMKSLNEEWKRLPDSQKQMYIQLAQDDKIRYENEMKVWEEQMIEIGREDLVRVKARKRLISDSAVMHKAKSKKELPKTTIKKITKPTKGDKAEKWMNEE